MPFEEKQPPRDAKEYAERAAEDTARVTKENWEKTKQWSQQMDDQYKIKEKSAQLAEQTKTGFMSLWGKAKEAAAGQQAPQQ